MKGQGRTLADLGKSTGTQTGGGAHQKTAEKKTGGQSLKE